MTIAEILAYPDACPVSDLALTVQRAGGVRNVTTKSGGFQAQDLTCADATGQIQVSLGLEGLAPVAAGAALTVHKGTIESYRNQRVVRCTSKNGGATVSQNTLAPPPPAPLPPGAPAPAPAAPAYVPPARLTRKRAAELAVTTVEDAAVMAGFAPDLTKLPPEVFQALTAVANTILIGIQRGDIGLEEGE